MRLGLSNIYYLFTAFFCLKYPARLRRGMKTLDVGCGVGNLVWGLSKIGLNSFGIDPSVAAKNYSRLPSRCRYKKYKKLPYANSSFELVYSNEVLEHIPEKELPQFLRDLYRVSKGKMIHMICVKDRGKIIYSDPTHVTLKSEEWWNKLFISLGYSVKKGNIFYFFPNIFEIFTGRLKFSSIQQGYFYIYKNKNER